MLFRRNGRYNASPLSRHCEEAHGAPRNDGPWGFERKLVAFLLFLACLLSSLAHADAPRISVVYQEVAEPYRAIMQEMYKGISEELGSAPEYFVVPESGKPAGMGEWLANPERKLVIALGQRSFQALYQSKMALSLVVGAVLSIPQEAYRMNPKPVIVSYTPAPRIFFDKLRSLAPHIKRVVAVFDPRQDEWLIKEAKQAAGQTGVALEMHTASDLRASARVFKDILEHAAASDAIWITHNTQVVDDDAILPEILKEAWSKNLVVFSSRLTHVDKGALFALYPDNDRLGHRLAKIAEALLSNGYHGSSVQSLEDVQIAVNMRTASHLGLELSGRQNFDLTFPKTR